MIGGVTRLGGFPGLPGRVTLSAGVTICHVNVSRWGNPPSRGRVHEKKLKSETCVLKLCTFPSRLMAEITRNTQGVLNVHISEYFSVLNRPYLVSKKLFRIGSTVPRETRHRVTQRVPLP